MRLDLTREQAEVVSDALTNLLRDELLPEAADGHAKALVGQPKPDTSKAKAALNLLQQVDPYRYESIYEAWPVTVATVTEIPCDDCERQGSVQWRDEHNHWLCDDCHELRLKPAPVCEAIPF